MKTPTPKYHYRHTAMPPINGDMVVTLSCTLQVVQEVPLADWEDKDVRTIVREHMMKSLEKQAREVFGNDD